MSLNMNQATLKERLSYDPLTGVFTWLNGQRKGKIAGTRHKSGYVNLSMNCQSNLAAHRMAFLYTTGKIPEFIDHINHVKHDNRWSNLRAATRKDNDTNKALDKRNKYGICGISFSKAYNKLHVCITLNKQNIFLGLFDDFFEACCTRKSSENKLGFHKNHGRPRI